MLKNFSHEVISQSDFACGHPYWVCKVPIIFSHASLFAVLRYLQLDAKEQRFCKTSSQPLFKISDLKMDQVEDLNLELQFADIPEWPDLDGILELGSDGTSPLSSPNHYSTGSSCSSPFSTGSSLSPLNSPDPTLTDQQLFSVTGAKCESGVTSKKRASRGRRTRKGSQRSGETKHKRNERERRRVKKLSDAFINLRDSVPYCVGDKKLSKLETLKYALYYMYTLSGMLYEDDMRKRAVKTEQWLAIQQDELRKSQVSATRRHSHKFDASPL